MVPAPTPTTDIIEYKPVTTNTLTKTGRTRTLELPGPTPAPAPVHVPDIPWVDNKLIEIRSTPPRKTVTPHQFDLAKNIAEIIFYGTAISAKLIDGISVFLAVSWDGIQKLLELGFGWGMALAHKSKDFSVDLFTKAGSIDTRPLRDWLWEASGQEMDIVSHEKLMAIITYMVTNAQNSIVKWMKDKYDVSQRLFTKENLKEIAVYVYNLVQDVIEQTRLTYVFWIGVASFVHQKIGEHIPDPEWKDIKEVMESSKEELRQHILDVDKHTFPEPINPNDKRAIETTAQRILKQIETRRKLRGKTNKEAFPGVLERDIKYVPKGPVRLLNQEYIQTAEGLIAWAKNSRYSKLELAGAAGDAALKSVGLPGGLYYLAKLEEITINVVQWLFANRGPANLPIPG